MTEVILQGQVPSLYYLKVIYHYIEVNTNVCVVMQKLGFLINIH
jgi:hypothetical protein